MISISGPPFSGKSTLWAALQHKLTGRFHFVPDLPRQALETLDPGMSAWSVPEFQGYVGFAQLLAEQAVPPNRVAVCDKSLIDALAYARVLFAQQEPSWSGALAPGRYALALVCDYRDVDAAPDGLHSVHIDLREQIETEVLALADISAARVLRLSGSPTARLARAVAEIEHLHKD